MFGSTAPSSSQQQKPREPGKPTTVTAPAPLPPPRPAQQPMGSSGRQAFSSAPRTQPSLIGSTTALTRKPNLQRRTLIGGVS